MWGARIALPAAAAAASLALGTATANAAVSHTVVPGETLSGIAAANGLSTETLAAWNGLDPGFLVVSGSALSVPAVGEVATAPDPAAGSTSGTAHAVVAGETLSGVAAANGVGLSDLAATNGLSTDSFLTVGQSLQIPALSTTAVSTSAPTTPAPGLGAIPSPWGDLYLEAGAASSWNAMRQQALTDYGVDLYPAGPLSAYRTSGQQGEMYDLFLSGIGAPANPPGMSSHELGASVDLATEEMRSVIDQIGPLYGWGKFEAPDEWWHVTYGG